MNRLEIVKIIHSTKEAKEIGKVIEKKRRLLDPNRESKLRAKRRYNRVKSGKLQEPDYTKLQEEFLKSKGLV